MTPRPEERERRWSCQVEKEKLSVLNKTNLDPTGRNSVML